MTTLERYPGLSTVIARLEGVRRRHVLVQAARAAVGLAAVVLACLAVIGAAGFWPGQPPAAVRWGLLAGVVAALAGGVVWLAVLPIRGRLNELQAARLVEERIEGLKNGFTNALLLADDAMQPSPSLVARAIHETVRRTGKTALGPAVSLRSLRRWLIAAAVAAAVVGALAVLAPGRLSRGLAAVFRPTAYVRHLGSVKLISLAPGDATCFAGQEITVVARVANPRRRRLDARLRRRDIGPDGAPAQAADATLLPSPDRTTYTAPLGKVQQSFQYAVHIGDSKFPPEKPWYTVTVLQRVDVKGLDLTYRFPAYTGLAERPVPNAAGPIEAPVGTAVEVALRLSAPVPRVALDLRGGEPIPMLPDTNGRTFRGVLHVTTDGAYRILLTDAAGHRLQQVPDVAGAELSPEAMEGFYRIRAVPDDPPKVRFVEPARDVSVAPGGRLATRLRASDDHGLADVRFHLAREGKPFAPMRTFDEARGKKAPEDLHHRIDVGEGYREGDVIVYYASATDGRSLGELGGPQTAESARFKVFVRDAAKVAAERTKRYDELREKLLAILKMQEVQRVNTEVAAKKSPDLAGVRAVGGRIAEGQKAIRVALVDVVDHFPFAPEMLTVQQELAMLAGNDAAVAVTQARVVAGLSDLAGRADACEALAGTQEKIIQALQTLLAILPSLANPEAARQTARGGDIPPEAAEKLAELRAALEKYIDEQRKIIEASRRLTKRPVDNFTAEQEKLLKELELAQDKWEKFLNEKFTDFSKMAQQDFSNPSMLKELISVKTDVTMAKDALKKKAVEIATAIEDNGIENAKTLTANIEKWLPDEPDRIKWQMEDPAGQSNVEQPELPKELEDLVGDLLEEEEDLFEEMDDVTGKYTMSGDKGIGWDAMDGPISNMNAQGVTGNQLPNTSEISGRSGEGRQGKAVGEFVEDKAVGKGGRRTPTRLSPEPFQQGQVNDTSKEPAGGATGGGKLGGAGSEGLEGPLPPELQKELKRLAGRQAQLRNKAERMRAAFKVTDYSNYQFLRAVTLMGRVATDLERLRYVNALRRKDVTLGALQKTRLLLSGQIEVTADATPDMPKYVKDDIADAMKAKLPAEYRDALMEYFTRMAETGE